jgi:uncharacterized protein YdeI (YjbR/CyaY-like superfamily)
LPTAVLRRGRAATGKVTADEHAATFFATLSNSMQRYHVDNINAAKSAETRQRRVEKALAWFRAGKQR